jgi:hypothetical protein
MEIVNRVAGSGLITIDLQELVDQALFECIDIRPALWQGLALREADLKSFTEGLIQQDFSNKVLWLDVPNDIVVPQWAYIWMQSKLYGKSKGFFLGPLLDAQRSFLKCHILNMQESDWEGKRVVIKGCTDQRITPEIQMLLVDRLLPWVKSLMYGEPCSTVPLFKRS